MKNARKLGLGLAALMSVAAVAWAVGLSGTFINNPAAAYTQRYSFNLANLDINQVTATVTYATATFQAATFTSGSVSTGSFTVASNVGLSTAVATNNIVVVSTTGNFHDSIVVPKRYEPGAYVFLSGRDWNYGATTAATASSIAAALSTIPWLSVNAAGSVVYSTAPVGSFYNTIPMTTNNPTNLTIATAKFQGGQDNASVTINGTTLQNVRDWNAGASASASATAIAAAINANTYLSSFLHAQAIGSVVTATSTYAGTAYNFSLAVSTPALTAFNANMYGGTTPSWTLGGKTIAVPNHGWATGLALLYTKGGGNAVIGGLTDQTTYYAIVVDANDVQLASSLSNATAGTAITLTSSSTLVTPQLYTLAPLAFAAGSAGFQWQGSADGVNWTNLGLSSASYSAAQSGVISWTITPTTLAAYQYLGFSITGPTSGALNIQVTGQGNYTF
jgi:hypothetical protein